MSEKSAEKEESLEVGKTNNNDSNSKRENTRSTIALIYVSCFLGIITVCFVGGTIVGYSVDDHKDMLLTISGVLSGPLGFIVGYYFKASKE